MIQDRQILKFFPQPVFKYQYKNFQEINKDLTKYIYDLRDADKDGLERSNVHGWHSKNFNLKNPDSIQNKFLISFNVTHTHPNSYLSAAYYVKTPKNCGKFLIENPNAVSSHSFPKITKKNDLNSNTRGLDIKEGDLLFFPSYLPHRVGKNESDEDRIVISFNINVNHFV